MREAVCGPSTLAVLASTGPGCVAWGSRAAFRKQWRMHSASGSCKINVSGRLSGKLCSRERIPGLPVLAWARILPGEVP